MHLQILVQVNRDDVRKHRLHHRRVLAPKYQVNHTAVLRRLNRQISFDDVRRLHWIVPPLILRQNFIRPDVFRHLFGNVITR
jgi:hypothetical protein